MQFCKLMQSLAWLPDYHKSHVGQIELQEWSWLAADTQGNRAKGKTALHDSLAISTEGIHVPHILHINHNPKCPAKGLKT